jgi:hypothetical protein
MVSHAAEGAFYRLSPKPSTPTSDSLKVMSEQELSHKACSVPNRSRETALRDEQPRIDRSQERGTRVGAHVSEPSSKIQSLGAKDLPWNQNFPTAYDWIQAEYAGSRVFIAQPKTKTATADKKRQAEDAGSDSTRIAGASVFLAIFLIDFLADRNGVWHGQPHGFT